MKETSAANRAIPIFQVDHNLMTIWSRNASPNAGASQNIFAFICLFVSIRPPFVSGRSKLSEPLFLYLLLS